MVHVLLQTDWHEGNEQNCKVWAVGRAQLRCWSVNTWGMAWWQAPCMGWIVNQSTFGWTKTWTQKVSLAKNGYGSIEVVAAVAVPLGKLGRRFGMDHSREKQMWPPGKWPTVPTSIGRRGRVSPSKTDAANQTRWLARKLTRYTNSLISVFGSARKLPRSVNVDLKPFW